MGAPSPPRRSMITSAMMLTAISSGVSAPIASPIGVRTALMGFVDVALARKVEGPPGQDLNQVTLTKPVAGHGIVTQAGDLRLPIDVRVARFGVTNERKIPIILPHPTRRSTAIRRVHGLEEHLPLPAQREGVLHSEW